MRHHSDQVRPRLVGTAVALAGILLVACGGGGNPVAPPPPPPPPPPPAPVVSTVVLNRSSATLAIGGRVQLTASARDAAGVEVPGATVVWNSGGSVATVTASGLVSGASAGTTSITATSQGKSGAAQIKVVTAAVGSAVLDPAQPSLALGQSVQLQLLQFDAEGLGTVTPATWTTADPAVATVLPGGEVTATGAGSVEIRAAGGSASAASAVTVVAFDAIVPSGKTARPGINPPSADPSAKGGVCALSTDGGLYCAGYVWGSSARRVAPALHFRTIAGSEAHFCGVSTSGAAYCWESGQDPQPVPGNILFASISAGGSGGANCGLTDSGQAYCWGGLVPAQALLGDGTQNGSAVPVAVATAERFSQLSTGPYRACGRTLQGGIHCWGVPILIGAQGQGGMIGLLGTGIASSVASVPVQVNSALTFEMLGRPGDDWTCALSAGAPYCWGYMRNLGPGKGTDNCGLSALGCNLSPAIIATAFRFTALASSWGGTCGLTNAGEVVCWGVNGFDALGTGTDQTPSCALAAGPCLAAPSLTISQPAFRTISGGGDNFCGVSQTGRAYCWGANVNGQLTSPAAGTSTPTPTLFKLDPSK